MQVSDVLVKVYELGRLQMAWQRVRQNAGAAGIEVVVVGDRGMVKAKAKAALTEQGLKYITALTDPQIRTLLKRDVIQLNLFDETLQDVEVGARRLILRRNEALRHKLATRRQDKVATLSQKVVARHAFVQKATRATPEPGQRQLTQWAKQHKLLAFTTLTLQGTQLLVEVDMAKQAEAALLDGCSVLETDVPQAMMDAATVDARYRNLQRVERDFRTMKTGFLELHLPRPDGRQAAIFAAWGIIPPPPPHGQPRFTCRQRSGLAKTINSLMTSRG